MIDLPPTDPDTGDVIEAAPFTRIYPVRTLPALHWRAVRVIWFAAGLVDVLVGLRFLLKLLGASVQSPFVALLYGFTGALVAPFRGSFPVRGEGAFVLEPASLVALVIYLLAGLGAATLIRILGRRRASMV
jgi:YggT family protein